jgi:hypothetical protein
VDGTAEATSLPNLVGIGCSRARDAAEAVAEAAAGLDLDRTCFIQVMVPDHLDRDALAQALNSQLRGVTLFGFTTAGQITPQGYEDEALMLLAFPKAYFRCATALIAPLNPVSIKSIAEEARRVDAGFVRSAGANRLAFVFADGQSNAEDLLLAALGTGLGNVPIFGGSAGCGPGRRNCLVFHSGSFHGDAALLVLVETTLEYSGLGFHHFEPTDQHMVVTAAEPERRLVLELNGSPAAPEYARLLGHRVEDLSPEVFAENPVLVRANGTYHVRAIRRVEPGNGLSFLSAIDDGLVLTLGRGREILQTLSDGLSGDGVAGDGARPGEADFILGFDCYLRKLEIRQKQLVGPVSRLLSQHRVIGFNTFGEQHHGVHVNQTFVGVAFYPPEAVEDWG